MQKYTTQSTGADREFFKGGRGGGGYYSGVAELNMEPSYLQNVAF